MMYLIQVTAYTGILYLVYALLLRNKPIHAFNRAYLLGAALLPMVLPFIKLPTYNQYFEKARVANVRLPEVIAATGYEKQVMTQTVNWVLIAYVAVACALFALFIYKRIRLQLVIRKSTRLQEKGYTILLNTTYGPGSWGRYILLPDETINETIIQHEAAHVYMKHSTDVVLMQFLQCICWPNLFLHAINKELKQIHEFQADAAVGMDRLQYSELLLSNVFDTCTLPLIHSFNIHPLKRRIAMLKKRESPMAIVFGATAILATGAILFNVIALQSCKAKKWEVANEVAVDKGASFDGELNEFISTNMKYPKAAMDNGLEGRVVIRFKVDEEGNVTEPTVLTENYSFTDSTKSGNVQPGVLADAAMEVIRKMPKWTPAEKDGKPVAVYYQQPFTFKLGGSVSFKLRDKPMSGNYTKQSLLLALEDKKRVTEKELEEAMKVIENYTEQQSEEAEKQMKEAEIEMRKAEEQMKEAEKNMKLEADRMRMDAKKSRRKNA